MTTTHGSREQLCERAALYSLGILETDEVSAFAAHLGQGCLVCCKALAAFSDVVEAIAYTGVPRSPRALLRERVLTRIADESSGEQTATIAKDGLFFARSRRFDWQPLPVPGLEIKLLAADEQRGVTTHLVRMQPGASYPSHRHAGVEELYLLEGNLLISGVLMEAGDYCRAEPDSCHTGITSPDGCVVLSTACIRDEVIA